jgi:Zn-finger nucleic acid-binding protein
MTEKPSQNEDEYFARQSAELLIRKREELERQRVEEERRSHFMKCPKDGYDLATTLHHGVSIDVCSHCGGMWLDAGELDQLATHEDRPGLLGRVIGDVLGMRKREHKGG